MAKFRKKPVVIEAVQLNAVEINSDMQLGGLLFNESPEWLSSQRLSVKRVHESDYAHIEIETFEGNHLASPGDWIIRGVHGELYPCKPEIFEKTYEPAE